MTIESDLRQMSRTVSSEFALVRRMEKEGRLDLALEEYEFAKEIWDKLLAKLDEVNGKKIGLAGRIFRHPYRVPEDIQQMTISLGGEYKKLGQLLEKKNRQVKNLENRSLVKNKGENK